MRFFKGNGGVTETIKIINPSFGGCDANATVADHHLAHIKFIVKKDEDYLGFGCKNFFLFQKQANGEFKEF